jgi:hypothetical protein
MYLLAEIIDVFNSLINTFKTYLLLSNFLSNFSCKSFFKGGKRLIGYIYVYICILGHLSDLGDKTCGNIADCTYVSNMRKHSGLYIRI